MSAHPTTIRAQRSTGPDARIRATVAGQIDQDAPRVSPRIIAAIETTKARAATLLMDGYTVEPIDAFRGYFFVRRPTPLVDRRTGEITEGYIVNVIDGTCDCPQFVHSLAATGDGQCKHCIAAREEVRKAFALLGLLPPAEAVAAPAPAPAPTRIRWQVVEQCPKLGELPGLVFDTEAEARKWIATEQGACEIVGEPVPVLTVRQVLWDVPPAAQEVA